MGKKKFIKKNVSKIIEVGSNDGTFLKNFSKKNFDVLGFEPSKNVSDLANKIGIKSINSFFNKNSLKNATNFIGKTDIIFGANVICHIPNLIEFIETANVLLNESGKIIFEEPYLGSMYKKTSYDQIYDEHIFIFSITSIKKIFELYDFQIIDAIKQATHGGSMRYILKRKNISKKSKRVKKLIKLEKIKKIDKFSACLSFKKKVIKSRLNLRKRISLTKI